MGRATVLTMRKPFGRKHLCFFLVSSVGKYDVRGGKL